MGNDELLDPGYQFLDAPEGSAANRLLRDEREPPLYLLQPAGIGRGEMRMEPGVASKPRLNLGMLVRTMVVHHQVRIEPGGNVGFDLLQESKELSVSMT
jgi:hypothetical protein